MKRFFSSLATIWTINSLFINHHYFCCLISIYFYVTCFEYVWNAWICFVTCAKLVLAEDFRCASTCWFELYSMLAYILQFTVICHRSDFSAWWRLITSILDRMVCPVQHSLPVTMWKWHRMSRPMRQLRIPNRPQALHLGIGWYISNLLYKAHYGGICFHTSLIFFGR